MNRAWSRGLLSFLLGLTTSTLEAAAGPLSVGVSHQVQVGWVQSSETGTRLTRLMDEGTAGQNIKPVSGDGSFRLYGTPFTPDDPNESFDYRSTLRDTTTVSDIQRDSLTIYATQSNTYNTVNTAPLGYFQQGNSAF